jgi:predicted nuclease of restriction endonuclease-like (RecB) superfamily
MDYGTMVQAILTLHRDSVGRAAGAVNQYLLFRNWLIGAYVVEYEQCGEDRAAYGAGLLADLARDLRRRGVGGCSAEMLGRMRSFYRSLPQLRARIPPSAFAEFHRLAPSSAASGISSSLMTKSGTDGPIPLPADKIPQLSWTHWIELLQLDDPWKRAFYENECLNGTWSVRQLKRQIGSLLYERTGLSKDKRTVIEIARKQATEAPAQIADLIRDPYVLEFAGLAERPRYRESDLESALLDHLQNFLLELGTGFCFEARQRRISVGNEHDYIDLVFYHSAALPGTIT